MSHVDTRVLSGPVESEFAGMTFPIYRRLLALSRTTRHPEQGDPWPIDPLAVGAYIDSRPVGLALAEVPAESDRVPELLSVYVNPDCRQQGIASALVGSMEEEIQSRDRSELQAVFTTGKPSIAHIEKLFARRGWSPPEPRALSLRFTPDAALKADMFEERRMKVLARNLEIFPWSELGDEERAEIRRTNAESRWITEALEPWHFDQTEFDASSIGARFRGRVVGWMINHRATTETVRFTCSFMHKGLSKRGRILPLYRHSIEIVRSTGGRNITFVTPFCYRGMVKLSQRWIAPFAHFVGETRGCRIRLPRAA